MNQALKESKKKTTKTTYISNKKEEVVPSWFNKEYDKEKITIEEEEEMKDLLKEFS